MPGYPPDRHVLRDLRFSMLQAPGRPDRVLMPLVDELRDASGAPALGALAVAVDLAAAGVAMRTIAPDWLATAELEIHAQSAGKMRSGILVAEPTLLRSGRTTTVFEVSVRGHPSEADLESQTGTPLAHSTMTFVRITRPDVTSDLEHPTDPTEPSRVDFALPRSGLQSAFLEELGIESVDPTQGALELPADEFAKNSFGSLQGGVVATLAQAACEAATSARLARPAAATDLSVHYLAQGKGPYATRSTLLRGDERSSLHRVEIIDIPTQTLMATASTTSVALASGDRSRA